jgi:aspartyl-tRNA(Asn)/glutamyl-tRNA(Gln) amidotransferase subunit C
VNVHGVEPLIYMTDSINVLRADEYKPEITQAEALKNAPLHDSDYFKIAKVLKS